MTASIWFTADGEAATRSATEALGRRGFRVVRSFDLRSVVGGQHPCACPHHGTEQCTCQYVVLLAYAPTGAPIVITAHSRDGEAELQIVDDPNAPTDPDAISTVAAALADAALALQQSRAAAEVDAC
jgi:hypothetical protein